MYELESGTTPLVQFVLGHGGIHVCGADRDEMCQKRLKFCGNIYLVVNVTMFGDSTVL